MNQAHLDLLASDDWRQVLQDMIVPYAFDARSPADLGDDVLEAGPGPGLTTDLLSPQVPAFTAVELDPALASALRERYVDTPSVTVVEGDATAMPFEEEQFSGAVSFTMLHHVPTPELQDALFAEVRRVLRPGGLFIGSDSVASPELADLTLYVIDVAAGEEIPRKGGPAITRSDLLVINKTDLAPHVGASLEIMARDAARMRGSRPVLFTALRHHEGQKAVLDAICDLSGLSPAPPLSQSHSSN